MRRQFQKKRPKSDNFYGSLFTIRETEDRVREGERESINPAWSGAQNQVGFIDPNKAQRLINQGRVSLSYPRDNSKGSPLNKLSPAGHPPEFPRTPQSKLHMNTSLLPQKCLFVTSSVCLQHHVNHWQPSPGFWTAQGVVTCFDLSPTSHVGQISWNFFSLCVRCNICYFCPLFPLSFNVPTLF